MIKPGVTSYSLSRAVAEGKMDHAAVLRWIAENGGMHMELSSMESFFADPENCKNFKAEAKKLGIELSSYTIGANFVKPTPEEVRGEINRIKSEVEIAASLGVKRMRHDAGWRPIPECSFEQYEKDLPVFVDACGEIADHAAKYGIVTSVENHGYLMQGSERVQRLILTVNRPNFRTTLDIGNFLCVDEDPVSAVRNNIKYASMIHFKDFYIRESMPVSDGFLPTAHGRLLRGSILGHGDIDLPAIVKIIKDSGYDGFASVEFEGFEECCFGTKTGLNLLKKLLEA